jgi:hypothetical protein
MGCLLTLPRFPHGESDLAQLADLPILKIGEIRRLAGRLTALEREPSWGYFCQVLTEIENEDGDIPNMYRDSRGILYHPHDGTEIPLGTLAVENYERPLRGASIRYCTAKRRG